MAVSTTTFDQRIHRIQTGKTPHSAHHAKVGRAAQRGRVPFTLLFIVSVLMAGAAYAVVGSQADYGWVVALAG